MAQTYNPFDVIELRLNSIENLLLDLKYKSAIPPQPTEQHFSIDELCQYPPQKPAKATVYSLVSLRKIPFTTWLMQGKRKTRAEIAEEATNYLKKGGANNGK